MRYSRFKCFVAAMALSASFGCVNLLAQASYSGIGSPATNEDMGNLAWASGPSGKSLPPGSGTAKQGETIFMAKCSMCHGPDAHGVHWIPGKFSPVGGLPLTLPPRPSTGPHDPWVPPITSGAPFPEVIFNTIAVEMPMFKPGTLTADEVYSLTAFVLFKNGFVKEDEVLNRETLSKIEMPNGKYFPAPGDVYLDMEKRGCYKTYGVCVGN
jgi:mono/diheme cytochrome c family protein